MYSFSTTWNIKRHTALENLIAEITALGFSNIELSSSFPPHFIHQLKKHLNTINITSLHNYCPSPIAGSQLLPDDFSLASLDEEERKKAVKYTKISLDTAFQLKAKALVVHLGRVEIACKHREIIQFISQNKAGTLKKAACLKTKHLQEREHNKQKHLSQVMKSVDEINKYALDKKIKIGVENRYYLREIPSLEEIGTILNNFRGGSVFYWHDTGHAQVKENIGLEKHEAYLDRYAKDMIGIHLHDVILGEDHSPPSFGNFDFKRVKPFIKKNTIKVLEIHQPYTAEEVKKGYEFIKTCFNNQNHNRLKGKLL